MSQFQNPASEDTGKSSDVVITMPLYCKPILKEKVWGGFQLHTQLNKLCKNESRTGESWELSIHGMDITQLVDCNGTTISFDVLLGMFPISAGDDYQFPLLFKLIDAHENLSIQVHPTDKQAQENGWGRNGKTECWYIIAAKPDATIIAGTKQGLNAEQLQVHVRSNTLESCLNTIKVKSGDVIFIPAGTIHAILEGVLLYEVNQSSDSTFRLFDWNRNQEQGSLRSLHIKESLQSFIPCIKPLLPIEPLYLHHSHFYSRRVRVACSYFALEEFIVYKNSKLCLNSRNDFQIVSCISGYLWIGSDLQSGSVLFTKGDTIVLPGTRDTHLFMLEGEPGTTFLLTYVPNLPADIVSPLVGAGYSKEQILQLGGSVGYGNDIIVE